MLRLFVVLSQSKKLFTRNIPSVTMLLPLYLHHIKNIFHLDQTTINNKTLDDYKLCIKLQQRFELQYKQETVKRKGIQTFLPQAKKCQSIEIYLPYSQLISDCFFIINSIYILPLVYPNQRIAYSKKMKQIFASTELDYQRIKCLGNLEPVIQGIIAAKVKMITSKKVVQHEEKYALTSVLMYAIYCDGCQKQQRNDCYKLSKEMLGYLFQMLKDRQ